MKGLLKSAIRDNNPVIVFEHGGLGRLKEDVPAGDHLVPLGKAAVKREGEQRYAWSRSARWCRRR